MMILVEIASIMILKYSIFYYMIQRGENARMVKFFNANLFSPRD